MRPFALSSLIPLAFGILASAAPTPINIDVGLGGGTDSGGGINTSATADLAASLDVDIDVSVSVDANSCASHGSPSGPCSNGGLRRGYNGGGSDGGLFDSDDGDPIDIGALAGVDGEKSLESILCRVVSSIDALVDEISNLDAAGSTVETLDPILTEVKGVLTGAINEVNGLKGLAVGAILNNADGLLDATGLAKLLANVVFIVVKLVNLVLSLVSPVVKDDVLSLLVDILCLVGELLACVLGLVGSVLTGVPAILGVLVKDVLSIFVQLKIQIVIDLFKVLIPERVA